MIENTNDTRIPIILVTGFLGAGKTTLVNRLLSGALGPGAGVLVNDFGDIAVDSALLRRNTDAGARGIEIFEVTGGSIFCACKTAGLAEGLRMFARMGLKHLVMEASGMSDPSGLDTILADYRLAADFRLGRVVCLADAVRTPRVMGNLPVVKRQIECADLILVNKSDLARADALEDFEKELKVMNPGAEIRRTVRADIDPSMLTATASGHRRAASPSSNTAVNRPGTLRIDTAGVGRAALDAFLRDRLNLTWRIKGWVRADGNWWYVSDNAGTLEWEESLPPEGYPEGLTVITPPGGGSALADAWRAFLAGRPPVRPDGPVRRSALTVRS
jgi:G3E family GTPase